MDWFFSRRKKQRRRRGYNRNFDDDSDDVQQSTRILRDDEIDDDEETVLILLLSRINHTHGDKKDCPSVLSPYQRGTESTIWITTILTLGNDARQQGEQQWRRRQRRLFVLYDLLYFSLLFFQIPSLSITHTSIPFFIFFPLGNDSTLDDDNGDKK